jgi:small subunit ribosomal protein S18
MESQEMARSRTKSTRRPASGGSRPFRRRKVDPFLADPNLDIDYKDPRMLRRFLTDTGKILPRRLTGLNASHQRTVSRAIKRARVLGLLPFVAGVE